MEIVLFGFFIKIPCRTYKVSYSRYDVVNQPLLSTLKHRSPVIRGKRVPNRVKVRCAPDVPIAFGVLFGRTRLKEPLMLKKEDDQ